MRHDVAPSDPTICLVPQHGLIRMPPHVRDHVNIQCKTTASPRRPNGDRMHEQPLLTIGVECYAGHRGEQTPRTLVLGDQRVDVSAVVDAWLAPDYRYFKLRGADGNTYLVRHDERSSTWELTMFRAEHVDG